MLKPVRLWRAPRWILSLCLAFALGCATGVSMPVSMSVPADGTVAILSPLAAKQLDSIAKRSEAEGREQFACVERYSITPFSNGARLISLDRIGGSPLAWSSDSMSVWAPAGYVHLCYGGQPTLHTHPQGIDWPSEVDFHQAFENARENPFAVLLVTLNGKWKVVLYAVKP